MVSLLYLCTHTVYDYTYVQIFMVFVVNQASANFHPQNFLGKHWLALIGEEDTCEWVYLISCSHWDSLGSSYLLPPWGQPHFPIHSVSPWQGITVINLLFEWITFMIEIFVFNNFCMIWVEQNLFYNDKYSCKWLKMFQTGQH